MEIGFWDAVFSQYWSMWKPLKRSKMAKNYLKLLKNIKILKFRLYEQYAIVFRLHNEEKKRKRKKISFKNHFKKLVIFWVVFIFAQKRPKNWNLGLKQWKPSNNLFFQTFDIDMPEYGNIIFLFCTVFEFTNMPIIRIN